MNNSARRGRKKQLNENARRGDFGGDEAREISADEGCVHRFRKEVGGRCSVRCPDFANG